MKKLLRKGELVGSYLPVGSVSQRVIIARNVPCLMPVYQKENVMSKFQQNVSKQQYLL